MSTKSLGHAGKITKSILRKMDAYLDLLVHCDFCPSPLKRGQGSKHKALALGVPSLTLGNKHD